MVESDLTSDVVEPIELTRETQVISHLVVLLRHSAEQESR